MADKESLSQLAGKHVIGQDGEEIGRIADVYESTEGGDTFATVTTGLFGGGASVFPLEAAELRGDEVVVPYTKDFIKDAPHLENDEELTALEEQRLFEYYSLGSFTSARDGLTTATTTEMGAQGALGHGISDPTIANTVSGSAEQLSGDTEALISGSSGLRRPVSPESQMRTRPVSPEEVWVERDPERTAGHQDLLPALVTHVGTLVLLVLLAVASLLLLQQDTPNNVWDDYLFGVAAGLALVLAILVIAHFQRLARMTATAHVAVVELAMLAEDLRRSPRAPRTRAEEALRFTDGLLEDLIEAGASGAAASLRSVQMSLERAAVSESTIAPATRG